MNGNSACKVSKILILFSGLFVITQANRAQSESQADFRNFPIVLSIQFHSLALPFRDLKSNFRNIGAGIGTEVSLNGSHTWLQQFNVIWFRNRNTGNGWLFNTQVSWRPYLISNSYGELKAGIGYQVAFRPTESFIENNGKWTTAGKKGKGLLAVLAGISLGYHDYSDKLYTSPFISYQAIFLNKYSKSIPLMTETLIQAGLSTHLQ
jgi:hypothetical protein